MVKCAVINKTFINLPLSYRISHNSSSIQRRGKEDGQTICKRFNILIINVLTITRINVCCFDTKKLAKTTWMVFGNVSDEEVAGWVDVWLAGWMHGVNGNVIDATLQTHRHTHTHTNSNCCHKFNTIQFNSIYVRCLH